jgi:hypothetical protein
MWLDIWNPHQLSLDEIQFFIDMRNAIMQHPVIKEEEYFMTNKLSFIIDLKKQEKIDFPNTITLHVWKNKTQDHGWILPLFDFELGEFLRKNAYDFPSDKTDRVDAATP